MSRVSAAQQLMDKAIDYGFEKYMNPECRDDLKQAVRSTCSLIQAFRNHTFSPDTTNAPSAMNNPPPMNNPSAMNNPTGMSNPSAMTSVNVPPTYQPKPQDDEPLRRPSRKRKRMSPLDEDDDESADESVEIPSATKGYTTTITEGFGHELDSAKEPPTSSMLGFLTASLGNLFPQDYTPCL